VTSIGGNDIGFADIITQCAQTEPCFTSVTVQPVPDEQIAKMCDPAGLRSLIPFGVSPFAACEAWMQEKLTREIGSTNAAELFAKGLFGDPAGATDAEKWSLSRKYAELDVRLRAGWSDYTPDRMFITPYPNVTRDQNGNTCGMSLDAPTIPGISPAEYLWAEQVVLRLLNDTVEQQAATLGWTVVDGIEESFRTHGYCSTSPWMVRIGESFLRQMDHMGTAHPNAKGHETYRDKIFVALRDAFYPGSTVTALAPARVDRRP
jgi:hypothetical protein